VPTWPAVDGAGPDTSSANAACSCENSLLSRGVDHRTGGVMRA
jgi:hypothetical protein